eukprot:g38757.t1
MTEYWKGTECLVMWCKDNNLSLHANKTKELIIDFRKQGAGHAPIYINRAEVKMVESIKFLGVTITKNLTWTNHVDVMIKKAQQCLFFLRRLRKFGICIRTLTNFYRCTIESILSEFIMAWYDNCSAQDHKKLQKVVNTAQTMAQANLLSIDSICTSHCLRKAANFIKHPSQPGYNLFQLLLSGRRYK